MMRAKGLMIDYVRGCSWIPPIWALIIASSVVLG
jgi:hypothetical protein